MNGFFFKDPLKLSWEKNEIKTCFGKGPPNKSCNK